MLAGDQPRGGRVVAKLRAMTGLDTKKRIVAKFGAGVMFEKGKPMPKAK